MPSCINNCLLLLWLTVSITQKTVKSTIARQSGRKIGRPFTILEDGTQVKATEEAGFAEIEEGGFKVSHQGIVRVYT